MKRAIKTILGDIIRVGEGHDALSQHIQVNPLHEIVWVKNRKVGGKWVIAKVKY